VITAEEKRYVAEALERQDCRLSWMRSVKPLAPARDEKGRLWERREASKTLYILIAIGPTDDAVENAVRSALGHDPLGFPGPASRN
jgi:hypothetical protein